MTLPTGSYSVLHAKEVNGMLIYAGYDYNSKSVLWSRNLAIGKLRQLCGYIGEPVNFANSFVLDNKVLFFVNYEDKTNLYSTGGSPQGTFHLTEFNYLADELNVQVYNGLAIFIASGTQDHELWKTDGTIAGTMRLKIFTGFWSPQISRRDNVFYLAGNIPTEVWKIEMPSGQLSLLASIGSNLQVLGVYPQADGIYVTTRFKLFKLDPVSNEPRELVSLTDQSEINTIAFAANEIYLGVSSFNSSELLRIDPLTEASSKVTNFPYGRFSIFTVRNNVLIFSFYSYSGTTLGIFRFDGLSVETIKEFLKPVNNNFTYYLTDNYIVFIANDGATGSELWRTDGTIVGTYLLQDIVVGSAGGEYDMMTLLHGVLYFRASLSTSFNKQAVYRTDGTQEGTILLAGPTSPSSTNIEGGNRNEFIKGSSKIFFLLGGIWETDGTINGTKRISTSSMQSSPKDFVPAGDKFYFLFDDGIHGGQIWRSDGTSAGSYMVKDINPNGASINSLSMVHLYGFSYFSANDGVHGNELWRTDGTAEGTTLVYDAYPDAISNGSISIVTHQNYIFFRTNYAGESNVYRTDGTSEGTIKFRAADIGDMFSFKEHLYFHTYSKDFVRSNGEPGNEEIIESLPTGAPLYTGRQVGWAKSADKLFYSSGYKLWSFDGITNSLSLIENDSVEAENLKVFNGTVYFTKAFELWKSDGTVSGTIKIKNIALRYNQETLGYKQNPPYWLTQVGSNFYFLGDDGYNAGLWKSDGSASGTYKILNGSFSRLSAATNVLYGYRQRYPSDELWKSSGDSVTTYQIANITISDLEEFQGKVYLGSKNKILFISTPDVDQDGYSSDIDCNDLDPLSGYCIPKIEISFNGIEVNPFNPILLEDVIVNQKFRSPPIAITNIGKKDVVLNSVQLTGNDVNAFSIIDENLALSITPGDSTAVFVEFQPTLLKSYSINLVVASNDFNKATISIPITCSVIEELITSLMYPEKSILVYPNPVDDNIFIEVKSPQMKAEVLNIMGMRVLGNISLDENHPTVLNMLGQETGLYLLVITDGQKKWIRKFFKL